MRVRPVNEFDKLQIEAFIATDHDHKAMKMTAEFFFDPWHKLAMCFEDALGPVFFVRLDCELPDTIRFHIQFDCRMQMARRTTKMLIEGFPLVKHRCKSAKAKRLIFESTSASLRRFCECHLGFEPISGSAELELKL